MKKLLFAAVFLMLATPASATKKSCEELKAEIDAKLKAKGVKSYTLEIVPSSEEKEGKVVGTCDGGAMKILYNRGK